MSGRCRGPYTLKNRRTETGVPNVSRWARARCSPASLVTPYGETGLVGSVSSPEANLPYTLDVDPYTNILSDLDPFTASRSRWVAVTLHPRYRSKSVQLATSPGMAARW